MNFILILYHYQGYYFSGKSGRGLITKPMTSAHFKLIEEDLQARLKTPQSVLSGISNVHRWSAAQIGN